MAGKRRQWGKVFGWGVCAALAASAAAAQAGVAASFTSKEKLELRHGKLVARPTEERRGNLELIGGMSWRVVDVPVDVVRKVLLDPASYEHLLPGVSSFKQVSDGGLFKTVRICHKKGAVEGCYYANIRFADGGKDVFFQLDPNHENDLRAGWGFLRVTPYGDHDTLVAWGVMADMGHGILAGLMRPQVREWMLKVPSVMKKYLEHHYRDS